MLKKLLAVVFSVALIGASGMALAAKHGGEAGGHSAKHMSSEGMENTNGPESADRDKGQARAEDRRHEEGQANEKPAEPEKHGHGKHGNKH